MNKSTYFNKLIHRCPDAIGDTKPIIYVQSKWDEDNVHLILQDSKSNKSFKGILKKSEIAESAQELDLEYEPFYDECRAALTANLALPNFQYEIKDDALKVCKMEDFEIEYLSVNLQETDNHCEMLEIALSLLEEQREKTKLQGQVEAPSKDCDAIQSLVEEKNKLKNQWLKKFTLILNTKKEHICALENQLEKAKHGGGGSKASTPSKRRNADESTEEEKSDDDYMASTQPTMQKPKLANAV